MGVMPPYLIDLRVVPRGDRPPFHLWLPLILLWPLGLVLIVLALVFTILADIVLLVLGRPYHHYTRFLLGCIELLTDARGTTVNVTGPRALVDLTIK